MPITEDRILATQQEIFPTSGFPAEQLREAPGNAVNDSIAHIQFIALATIFIQHREPQFLTEVVAVWYLRAKINQAVAKVSAALSGYTDTVRDQLQANIDSEAASRIAGDTALRTDLTAEVAARSAGDTNLQNALTQEITDRTAGDTALRTDLTAEVSARSAADTALRTDLTAEVTARTAADSALRVDLTAETQARLAGDATLRTDLSAETAARTAGDEALRTDLTAEVTARSAGDAALQNSIDNETAARQTTDTLLQGNIDAEAAARAAADLNLRNDLNAETANRVAADNAMDLRLSNAIANEVNARTQADIQINDAIAAIRRGFVPPIQLVQTVPYTLGSPLPATVNDVAPVAGMRMLLTNQADPIQNRVIVIDDPATGAYHFPPDNVVQGTEYIYTSGGAFQGYSWVLSNPIDRDPVEGTDPLTWSPITRPDATRGDGTYTRLVGNEIRFIAESTPRLLQEQIGMLPPLVYLLGDGATGGTIQTDSATGNSFVVVDYAPLIRNLGLTLPVGTRTYYAMNLEYSNGGRYLGQATVQPISNDQVRVDFVGVQSARSVQLVLGGIVPTLASLAAAAATPAPTPAPTAAPTPVVPSVTIAPNALSISSQTPYTITLNNFGANATFTAQFYRNGTPAHATAISYNASQFPVSGTADVFGNTSIWSQPGPGDWQFRITLSDGTVVNSNTVTVGN